MISCKSHNKSDGYQKIEDLRAVYSQPDPSLWPEPTIDVSVREQGFQDIGTLPEMNFPADNPYSEAKKKLGKLLFFDPRLSKSGQIACASCHNPELAWTDNITRSFGSMRRTGPRNAMTIINSGYAHELFWDGRAKDLEHQAHFPIPDSLEMDSNLEIAVSNIQNVDGYAPLFEAAFDSPTVTMDRITKAIATFERTITSRRSKFDRFINGEKDLFTDRELRGMHIFRTKAQCLNCHNTPYFSDNKYHNDGQHLYGTPDEDLGRYYMTNDLVDLGKFRTPTLREVTRTGPWFHHGHFPNLNDVLTFYNLGNPAPIQKKYTGVARDSLIPQPSPLLKPLKLNQEEIQAVIAFLETLSTRPTRVNLKDMPE